MKQAILDTDTLSYILGERYVEVMEKSKQYFRVFRSFTVSSITIAEIVQGFEDIEDKVSVAKFIAMADGFEVLALGIDEAVLAAQIASALKRSGKSIGTMDPFIAAIAIINQRTLVTNNTKHYQRIKDLGFSLDITNWRTR